MTICGSSEAPAPFPRPVREYSIFPETAHGTGASELPHINGTEVSELSHINGAGASELSHINGAGASELPHMFKELNVP